LSLANSIKSSAPWAKPFNTRKKYCFTEPL
jgi:hypothetical protein